MQFFLSYPYFKFVCLFPLQLFRETNLVTNFSVKVKCWVSGKAYNEGIFPKSYSDHKSFISLQIRLILKKDILYKQCMLFLWSPYCLYFYVTRQTVVRPSSLQMWQKMASEPFPFPSPPLPFSVLTAIIQKEKNNQTVQ